MSLEKIRFMNQMQRLKERRKAIEEERANIYKEEFKLFDACKHEILFCPYVGKSVCIFCGLEIGDNYEEQNVIRLEIDEVKRDKGDINRTLIRLRKMYKEICVENDILSENEIKEEMARRLHCTIKRNE